MKKIIVDMFGADQGPETVVRGVYRALRAQNEYGIVLAGSTLVAQVVMHEEAVSEGVSPAELFPRLSVIETNSFVTVNDDPTAMVKDRNDTSMILALNALKSDDEIRGMVTAGNTGCAIVGSCFHLGLEKGLLRPVLASALPKRGGGYTVLADCGSNLEPRAKELEHYAQLASALCRDSYGAAEPVVGLVNVGTEKEKGTGLLKEAYKKIEAAAETYGYRFAGNIEGGDIISGKVDVAVCDGFTGNILLKGFESVGNLSAQLVEKSTERSEEQKAEDETALRRRQLDDPYHTSTEEDPSISASAKIRRFFDYNSQAGAIFLGTKKRVIKAHGTATADTICSCILQAINLDKGLNPANK